MGETMEDVKLLKGASAVDDRGYLSFVNDFDFSNVKRFYSVCNHDINFIRAWHGHEREAKYVYVVKGTILLGLVELDKYNKDVVGKIEDVKKFILSDKNPSVLYIPPGYFNGFKNLENDTRVIFYSTTTLEESKGDDIRLDYDYWNIWQENYR